MDYSKARRILLLIFIFGFVVQILTSIITFIDGAIRDNDLLSFLVKLLGIYSIHLAVIFGNTFSLKKSSLRNQIQVPNSIFNLAAILSTLWNLLLVWRSTYFMVASLNQNMSDSFIKLTTYIETISLSSSFLIIGVLSYFFHSNKK